MTAMPKSAAKNAAQRQAKPRVCITIVSGLPRSGTSMLMQMLEAGGVPVLTDGVRVTDVDNPRGYYELEAVKRTRQDPAWLGYAKNKAVKVIYKLLFDLPATNRYKVIFMRRPITEIISSQAIMLKRRGRSGSKLDRATLEKLFTSEVRKTRNWLHKQDNINLLEIEYAEVLTNPLQQAQLICQHIGSELDTTAMAEVVDQALYRQRNPDSKEVHG